MRELKRILYVEDEPDIQSVTRISLEMMGDFTVKVCSNGHEALSEACAFNPDLFLLDVMMPGLDGPNTLDELRKLPNMEKIPAIFMTAKVQSHEVEGLLKLGAIEVIAKPFDPMTLVDQINAAWCKYCGS